MPDEVLTGAMTAISRVMAWVALELAALAEFHERKGSWDLTDVRVIVLGTVVGVILPPVAKPVFALRWPS